MYDAPGIGLAAIQVGVPQRVVTMDLSKKEDHSEPAVFINPEIVWFSEEQVGLRGGLPVDPGHPRGRGTAGAGEGQVSRSRRNA